MLQGDNLIELAGLIMLQLGKGVSVRCGRASFQLGLMSMKLTGIRDFHCQPLLPLNLPILARIVSGE